MTDDTDAPSQRGRSMTYAATRLGVCRRTVYALIRRGVLRTYRVGRARRCTDRAIDEAIRMLEAET